ncbi:MULTISPECIES: hypothetical protein [unclassified Okeania]|uniref:hypothetical protein n=1 Tax=unclassified Okeania TaxID=2634635 RepID=UPI0013BBE02E|nr:MULTISPECIES: hypothetical protein [unclassified Okeania]NEP87822.1 hypothetical protein [Okeania sp. SIO2C2]NES77064.1 hypothetical protein [Okeania sp. SIO1H4]NET18559.1 hypothetical protein [Okeania sp. SIO1H5]NET94902.1 hypothetical protein [Okeania sp. SIO1H2]
MISQSSSFPGEVIIRVCAQKYFSRGRRQETTHPQPLRWRGEMDRERGSRSGRFVP